MGQGGANASSANGRMRAVQRRANAVAGVSLCSHGQDAQTKGLGGTALKIYPQRQKQTDEWNICQKKYNRSRSSLGVAQDTKRRIDMPSGRLRIVFRAAGDNLQLSYITISRATTKSDIALTGSCHFHGEQAAPRLGCVVGSLDASSIITGLNLLLACFA